MAHVVHVASLADGPMVARWRAPEKPEPRAPRRASGRTSGRSAPSALRAGRHAWALCFLLAACCRTTAAQVNIDGGRSELPGMKQDMFDRAQKSKQSGPQPRGRGPPDCQKSDKMSPFFGLAYVSGEVYVKVNSTESQCSRLISVGGANYTDLTNASRTCGPAGEWKKRIAEELSAVFFQGGLEWVKVENETIEVITEDGTFEAVVSEEKYREQAECWARGCGCEQAKNPLGRAILLAFGTICCIGLGRDGVIMLWEKIKGKKPPKHVQCRKGHRMEEVKFCRSHICDVCHATGTQYQCGTSCPYDLCKACYKAAKKKLKADMEEWLAKHPEDRKDKKKADKDEKDDEDDDKKDDDEDDKKGDDNDNEDQKEGNGGSDADKKEGGAGSDADSKENGGEDASKADGKDKQEGDVGSDADRKENGGEDASKADDKADGQGLRERPTATADGEDS